MTKDEFVEAFENVVKAVKTLEKKTADDVSALAETIKGMQAKLSDDTLLTLEEMKEWTRNHLATIAQPKDGKDGLPGADADEEYVISQVLSRIVMPEVRDPIMDTPIELRDKLESLKDDDRLDKAAIRGIDKIEERVKQVENRPAPKIGGAKGFQLLINGVKKLLTAQTVNFVPGSGVSISYAHAQGRNDITISASGGNISILTATGDIDGVNTSYTFASEPVVVIVNGASYRNTKGVSISGTSATLDFAPQVGSDVYGLG